MNTGWLIWLAYDHHMPGQGALSVDTILYGRTEQRVSDVPLQRFNALADQVEAHSSADEEQMIDDFLDLVAGSDLPADDMRLRPVTEMIYAIVSDNLSSPCVREAADQEKLTIQAMKLLLHAEPLAAEMAARDILVAWSDQLFDAKRIDSSKFSSAVYERLVQLTEKEDLQAKLLPDLVVASKRSMVDIGTQHQLREDILMTVCGLKVIYGMNAWHNSAAVNAGELQLHPTCSRCRKGAARQHRKLSTYQLSAGEHLAYLAEHVDIDMLVEVTRGDDDAERLKAALEQSIWGQFVDKMVFETPLSDAQKTELKQNIPT